MKFLYNCTNSRLEPSIEAVVGLTFHIAGRLTPLPVEQDVVKFGYLPDGTALTYQKTWTPIITAVRTSDVTNLKLSASKNHTWKRMEIEITAALRFWMKLVGQLHASAFFTLRKYTLSIWSWCPGKRKERGGGGMPLLLPVVETWW